MSNKLGIIQGRLSPRENGMYQYFPRNHWRQEFEVAEKLGLHYIELVFDTYDANPLLDSRGTESIRQIICESIVDCESICADYFMDYPLHNKDEEARQRSISVMNLLIEHACVLGANHIVIPVLEKSAIKDTKEIFLLKDSLLQLVKKASNYQVKMCIETDMFPKQVGLFLSNLHFDCIGICYDMGNSAFMKYDPNEEFKSYGERIMMVHAKNRTSTSLVELGHEEGLVDFKKVFGLLKAFNYEGPITLQNFREKSFDQDIKGVFTQLEFLRFCKRAWL